MVQRNQTQYLSVEVLGREVWEAGEGAGPILHRPILHRRREVQHRAPDGEGVHVIHCIISRLYPYLQLL